MKIFVLAALLDWNVCSKYNIPPADYLERYRKDLTFLVIVLKFSSSIFEFRTGRVIAWRNTSCCMWRSSMHNKLQINFPCSMRALQHFRLLQFPAILDVLVQVSTKHKRVQVLTTQSFLFVLQVRYYFRLRFLFSRQKLESVTLVFVLRKLFLLAWRNNKWKWVVSPVLQAICADLVQTVPPTLSWELVVIFFSRNSSKTTRDVMGSNFLHSCFRILAKTWLPCVVDFSTFSLFSFCFPCTSFVLKVFLLFVIKTKSVSVYNLNNFCFMLSTTSVFYGCLCIFNVYVLFSSYYKFFLLLIMKTRSFLCLQLQELCCGGNTCEK